MAQPKEITVQDLDRVTSMRPLEEIKGMAKKILTQYSAITNDRSAVKINLYNRFLALAFVLKLDLKAITDNDLTFSQKIIDLFDSVD